MQKHKLRAHPSCHWNRLQAPVNTKIAHISQSAVDAVLLISVGDVDGRGMMNGFEQSEMC
jgi:hypothetical protein